MSAEAYSFVIMSIVLCLDI